MNTCDTAVRVRGMLRCAKICYRTRTCATHFLNTAGLPVPVLNPSFVGHRPDTAQIRVRYVPAPVTGTVFAGTGTVWKIPTRGIPVPNPTEDQGHLPPLLSS